MLTRRGFLLSSLGLAFFPSSELPAWAKKKPAKPEGYVSLCRQEWPPAIMPDYAGFVDKGYSLFTDEFGRLAIVDLRKPQNPRVIGELSSLGRRVTDFVASGARGYALSFAEVPGADPEYMLIAVSLAPVSDPTILYQLPLQQFSEPLHVVANNEIICIGGTGTKGENLISVYAPRKGKGGESQLLSSFSVEQPISKLDLVDKHLAVLEGGVTSQIEYVNLLYPNSPQVAKAFKLNGDFRVMSRGKGCICVFGKSTHGFEARTLAMEPSPHGASSQTLGDITAVLDAAPVKDGFMLLTERNKQRLVLPVFVDKTLSIRIDQPIVLPASKDPAGQKAKIALSNREANVAFGSTSIDVLTSDKMGWKHSFTYAIPRLPASGVTISGDWVVLGGADLSLYDIAAPTKPNLLQKAESESAVKCVESAGSYVLALTRDALDIRKMESLAQVISKVKLSFAVDMSYDSDRQRAYVMTRANQKSLLVQVRVYSNNMGTDKGWTMPPGCTQVSTSQGDILVSALNDIYYYRAGNSDPELLMTRHFDNQAIRDICLTEHYALLTAVDRDSRGSIIVLARDGRNLAAFGSLQLPHDAATLAVSKNRAVVVGRTPDGKDMASIVELGGATGINVAATLPVIQAASSVVIGDHLAVVAGRGLEILNLT